MTHSPYLKFVQRALCACIFVFYSPMLFAAPATDITGMIINFSSQYAQIYRFITGFAYVFGFSLVFKAIYHLKVYGEARTMMSTQTSLKQPGAYLFVGAIFIFMPTAISVMLNSTFGSSSILAYGNYAGGGSSTSAQGMVAIGRLVQLIGITAFIRGWIMVTKAVQQGAQQSTGKALVHIIGGLCAINIWGFANVMYYSFGVSFTGN